MVSSAYLRLLIFLPAILIPACASSSPAFIMMYSAYKLNKRVTIYTLDVLLSRFGTSLLFHVQVASWPAYRFLKRQVRWSGIPISFRIFHSLWWSTVKDLGVINKAEVDIFLELSCFFDDPADNLNSGFSAFSKSSLNIWKFTVHILLKPGLKNFEYYFTSMWDVCNCAVVWAFFWIAFLWGWNENWTFPVLWPLLSFPYWLAYCMQHFHSIIF